MEQIKSSHLRYFKAKEENRQEISMKNVIMIKEIIRLGIAQIVEIGEFHLVVEVSMDKIIELDQGMNKAIGMTSEEETFRGNTSAYQNQNFRRQNNRGGYRGNYRNENYERGRSRSREWIYQGNKRWNEKSSISRSRLGWRVSSNRDKIGCYKCREYDHFAKDSPTMKVDMETDQIQQMFNLDEEQTSLKD